MAVIFDARRETDVHPAARDLAHCADVAAAADTVNEDIFKDVWPHLDDPTFHESVECSVRANVQGIFDLIAGEDPVCPPPEALDCAEVAARIDVPITELERAYRIGTMSLWTWWCEFAREHLDEAEFDELICGPTLAIHTRVDQVLESVLARHQEVRAEMRRTRRDLRRQALINLLEGELTEITRELEEMLDYHLSDVHLAILLETPEGSPPDAAVALLRNAVDARGTLLLQHGARSWVLWLGRPGGFAGPQLSKLRRVLREGPFTAAIGDPAVGVEGLRRTREQALETARVQRALGGVEHRCLWAHEVRLETMLLGDEQRARAFVADELGPLSERGESAQRLRETLLAWLSTGSHVSAAALLRVHENTIRNRIRAAEELLGVALHQRRIELQVALRLERVLHVRERC